MSGMVKAIKVLGEFYELERDNEQFEEFIYANDIGFPIAYFSLYNLVVPTEEAMKYLVQTWSEFCNLFGVDRYGEWESYSEFLDFVNSN